MRVTSDWKHNFLRLITSDKRIGAKKEISRYKNKNFETMKQATISACDHNTQYENKFIRDLPTHLEHLKHEFDGKSEICYYHATLIVLLRRRYKMKKTYSQFIQLWESESDYLLKHLSLRWIVSACDTFIDHSDDSLRKAILLNVVTLINTLRVHETKHFLVTQNHNNTIIQQDKLAHQHQRIWPLYDGLTYFRAGSDDTLNNMRTRYESFFQDDKLATQILIAVFERIHTPDSAFNMMKKLNKSRPDWWKTNK
ncbi:MAG: hypothetical protein KGV50_04325 [Gammaproteobacteria bacterium]|nr:hypothetical protein [Gammaproteobacteria bacterium]